MLIRSTKPRLLPVGRLPDLSKSFFSLKSFFRLKVLRRPPQAVDRGQMSPVSIGGIWAARLVTALRLGWMVVSLAMGIASSPLSAWAIEAPPAEAAGAGSSRPGDREELHGALSEAKELPEAQLRGEGLAVAEWVRQLGGQVLVERVEDRVFVVAVNLSGTPISDADLLRLSGLGGLRRLWLGGTAITDIGLTILNDFGSLEELSLAHTGVTDAGLPLLAFLPRLRKLSLEGTRITDAGIEFWAECAHPYIPFRLEDLSLARTQVGDRALAALSRFSRLRVLDLKFTAVTDGGLPHLAKLSHLQSVNLVGTKVTDEALAALVSQLPLEELYAPPGTGPVTLGRLAEGGRLKFLSLMGTGVTDEALAAVGKLTALRGLALGGTAVADRGLRFLEGLKELEFLDLTGTRLTEEGLASLGHCQKLKVLELRETQVGDGFVDQLVGLSSLEALGLARTKVTGRGLGKLSQLENLQHLVLRGNSLEEEVVGELSQLKQLQTLDVAQTGLPPEAISAIKKALPQTRVIY